MVLYKSFDGGHIDAHDSVLSGAYPLNSALIGISLTFLGIDKPRISKRGVGRDPEDCALTIERCRVLTANQRSARQN
jgi:hypothetical protein